MVISFWTSIQLFLFLIAVIDSFFVLFQVWLKTSQHVSDGALWPWKTLFGAFQSFHAWSSWYAIGGFTCVVYLSVFITSFLYSYKYSFIITFFFNRQNLNSDFTDSALGSTDKSPLPYGNFQLRDTTVQSILSHPRYGPKWEVFSIFFRYILSVQFHIYGFSDPHWALICILI